MPDRTLDYRAIFQASPVPAMVLDRDLVFVAASPAYCDLFGLSPDDVVGRPVFEVFPESPERVGSMRTVFEETLAGGRPTIREVPYATAVDGILQEFIWTAHHAPVEGASGEIEFLVQFTQNVTEEVRLRELKSAVLGELQHRIGNFFAVVRAIARQSGRAASDVAEFQRIFDERLEAFFSAQKDLVGQAGIDMTLRDMVEKQLGIFAANSRAHIDIEGGPLPLSSVEAQAVSMAIHELGTNSLKYGALGNPEGRVRVAWDSGPERRLNLLWHETGISAPKTGDTAGYGTSLLTTILPRQLGCTAERRFEADRFEYELTPIPALA